MLSRQDGARPEAKRSASSYAWIARQTIANRRCGDTLLRSRRWSAVLVQRPLIGALGMSMGGSSKGLTDCPNLSVKKRLSHSCQSI